jgi:membrane-associated phospholipid phosphatase
MEFGYSLISALSAGLTPGTLEESHMLFWSVITRLGQAEILLPAMAAGLLCLFGPAHAPALARRWLVATAVTALLTTATKVAFIGYGIGYAPWDFTGLSGHSMFAGVVLPVLMAVLTGHRQPALRHWATLFGVALAVLITISRVRVGAHSWAEAVTGCGVGLCASAWVLFGQARTRWAPPLWLPALIIAWLAFLPLHAPPSRTNEWVTTLALHLSGRPHPYTRQQMLRIWRASEGLATDDCNPPTPPREWRWPGLRAA